ncbi:hypothetical protein F443_07517 [Phytophthora nicotianae P1569]|uniref:Uncharacterized protein n=1 Tax=Phytophthora nicotianae P1569 TaxID=1317065 RepID=V9FCF5_PHYNI|nr:hypothetical protein F443_07517 [Phytophthora nicotianae P1569]
MSAQQYPPLSKSLVASALFAHVELVTKRNSYPFKLLRLGVCGMALFLQ